MRQLRILFDSVNVGMPWMRRDSDASCSFQDYQGLVPEHVRSEAGMNSNVGR